MTAESSFMVAPRDGEFVLCGGIGAIRKISSVATGGTFSVVEHPLEPGALAAPPHTHADVDEYSFVIEGETGVLLLLRARRRACGPNRRGRHGQGHARGAGGGSHLRHAQGGGPGPRPLVARRDAGRVNEALLARISANMFVTCFYAVLDPKSGRMSYANAGHDLPYLYRRAGNAEKLEARGVPLGLMPGMGYEEREAFIWDEHGILFYSDGLVEAHDPSGEMFGFPRLRALIAEHREEGSLGDLLLRELYSFVGEGWDQ
jgi:hypothetical protein